MREWVPTSASARGRLVHAALDAFGRRPYADVSVSDLAAAAATTTGPLYHHFGSKLGLYAVVRGDVERRVVDRIEGAMAAAAAAGVHTPDALASALTIAFDYVVSAGFTAMLAEQRPDRAGDPITAALAAAMTGSGSDVTAAMLAAAWRAALATVADSGDPQQARAAVAGIRIASGG